MSPVLQSGLKQALFATVALLIPIKMLTGLALLPLLFVAILIYVLAAGLFLRIARSGRGDRRRR